MNGSDILSDIIDSQGEKHEDAKYHVASTLVQVGQIEDAKEKSEKSLKKAHAQRTYFAVGNARRTPSESSNPASCNLPRLRTRRSCNGLFSALPESQWHLPPKHQYERPFVDGEPRVAVLWGVAFLVSFTNVLADTA